MAVVNREGAEHPPIFDTVKRREGAIVGFAIFLQLDNIFKLQ